MRGRALLLGALVAALIVSLAPLVAAENAPPEVRISSPGHGSTVSGTVVISGNAWDTDGTIVNVQVRIDAGEWWNATDTSGNDTWWSWETDWDTTKVPNGWHGITALATDNASARGDAGTEVYVHNQENRRPIVAIDEPPNHSTVDGIVTVKGRAEDPDANDTVEMVQVRIDAGDWVNATPTGDNGSYGHWAYNWNTTLVDDGWHGLSARAWDGSLWSEPVTYEYYVDNVPEPNRAPWSEIVHPRTGDTVWGVVLVHGEAGDKDVGDRVELVQVRVGDGEWRNATDTSHNGSWGTFGYQWDTTQGPNGEIHVCSRAYDGELWSEPLCRTPKVANENARPTVAIVHPENGQKVKWIVVIHGKAADDVAVKLVEIRFNDGEWRNATDTSPDGSWTTWAYEWDTRARDDGCVNIFARAWDGHAFSETPHVNVCVDNVNDRPWVKILDPEQGENVSGLYLVHGTAGDDREVMKVQVRIDDGEWEAATNTGHDKPWSTWAYEWDTRDYENGEHHVCARSYDGDLYSEVACRGVLVYNEGTGGAPPSPYGGALPYVALGLAGALGVAILMWLRTHGFLRK